MSFIENTITATMPGKMQKRARTNQRQSNQLNNRNYFFKYEEKSPLEASFLGINGYFKQMTVLRFESADIFTIDISLKMLI